MRKIMVMLDGREVMRISQQSRGLPAISIVDRNLSIRGGRHTSPTSRKRKEQEIWEWRFVIVTSIALCSQEQDEQLELQPRMQQGG
ncbi:unnamed protein product [Calypogeia fissa]